MGKKHNRELMMYQGGGMQTRQPGGMIMPSQQGLVPFQSQGSGGVFSNFMENLRLTGQVEMGEKKLAIVKQTAEAFTLSLRMAEEQALAPYKIAHTLAIMKHDLNDRKEARRFAKANRFKSEAETRNIDALTEQIKITTAGFNLDNELKKVKIAIAMTDLERSKLELDIMKKNMGSEE